MNSKPKILGFYDTDFNPIWIETINLPRNMTHSIKYPGLANCIANKTEVIKLELTEQKFSCRRVTLVNANNYNRTSMVRNKVADVRRHWSSGWVRSAYGKWVITHQLPRAVRNAVLGRPTKPSSFQMGSAVIHQVNISNLFAAFASTAYLMDAMDKKDTSNKLSVIDIVEAYVDEFELVRRHGKSIRSNIKKALNMSLIEELERYNRNADDYEPFKGSVDTFLFDKGTNQFFRRGD